MWSQRSEFKPSWGKTVWLAYTENTFLIGDFNLYFSKWHNDNYARKSLFNDFENKLGDLNLAQIVTFPTWLCLVGNNLKSSILDHIYLKDPTNVTNLESITFIFGDHLLISFNLPKNKSKIETTYKRDWRNYIKE